MCIVIILYDFQNFCTEILIFYFSKNFSKCPPTHVTRILQCWQAVPVWGKTESKKAGGICSRLQLVNVRVKTQTGLCLQVCLTFRNFPNHTDLFVKVSRLEDNELSKRWETGSPNMISTVLSKTGLQEGTGQSAFVKTWRKLVLTSLDCFNVQINWCQLIHAPGPNFLILWGSHMAVIPRKVKEAKWVHS